MAIPNTGMRNALRPSIQSYRHFTGFLAYGMVYSNKSNEHILIWDFVHRKVYVWVECPENFSSKEYLLPEILKSWKIGIFSVFCGIWDISRTLISREGGILLSWNFQDILLIQRPFCGQNLRSKYLHSICCNVPYHRLKIQ